MNVFIIHSNKDNDLIADKLNQLRENCTNVNILILKGSTKKLWKAEAKKQMKQADCALFFVGEESHKSQWIDWEIKKFIKMCKPIYTIKLAPNNIYNETLYKKSTFGNVEYVDRSKFMHSIEKPFDDLCQLFRNNLELDIADEIVTGNKLSDSAMIEQYKIYLKTSEDVVSRRQAVSNFYISVNSILISVLSAVVALLNALGVNYATHITFGMCILVSLVGIILCFNWRRLIMSYGKLNSAKMKVISAIEKKLPFNLYSAEWQVQTYRKEKRKYVSFTNIEKRLPTLFLALYTFITVLSAVLMCIVLI